MKSGPDSQIISQVIGFKVNPWQSGSTGPMLGVYHRKKMGQKYRRTHRYIDPFWTTAPKL